MRLEIATLLLAPRVSRPASTHCCEACGGTVKNTMPASFLFFFAIRGFDPAVPAKTTSPPRPRPPRDHVPPLRRSSTTSPGGGSGQREFGLRVLLCCGYLVRHLACAPACLWVEDALSSAETAQGPNGSRIAVLRCPPRTQVRGSDKKQRREACRARRCCLRACECSPPPKACVRSHPGLLAQRREGSLPAALSAES